MIAASFRVARAVYAEMPYRISAQTQGVQAVRSARAIIALRAAVLAMPNAKGVSVAFKGHVFLEAPVWERVGAMRRVLCTDRPAGRRQFNV